jgi:acyl-CoA synthetase (AMP-forming)/AMP-acid ligase II
MKVHNFLEKSVLDFSDNIAVVHHDRKITYRELHDFSGRVASFLNELPLEQGSRIALLWDNSIEYVPLFFATFKAGYVLVPLDTSLRPETISSQITDCGAKALFIQSKHLGSLQKIIGATSTLSYIFSDKTVPTKDPSIQTELLGNILERPLVPARPNESPEDFKFDSSCASDALAAIFYTSGSTGISKGVMLSHRNLISNTVATVAYLELTSSDRIMVILPYYYIYGNSLLLTHVAVGGTQVIDNRFMYPEVVLDTMEQECVTGFSGVPSTFMILLNKSSFASRDLPDLRYFTQAGGAMSPEIIKQLIAAFPDKDIYIMYGQTEASPRVSYLPPAQLKKKIGSIGIPVPGVTIKIVDEKSKEVAVGETGEIAVTGENVMLGYWNHAEEEAEVLRNGWLYTGDLGKQDEDGYFYIVGRIKEIIKTGGNRVSAKEVEERLLEHNNVEEVAVFAAKDVLLGEVVKSVVVLKDPRASNKKDLQDFCNQTLAVHKVPKYVEFIDELPKTQSGKVDKLILGVRKSRLSEKNTENQ